MPAFDYSKQWEPLQGQDARLVLQEAAGPLERLLGCKGRRSRRQGGQPGDNKDLGRQSSDDGRISLPFRAYIEREIGI